MPRAGRRRVQEQHLLHRQLGEQKVRSCDDEPWGIGSCRSSDTVSRHSCLIRRTGARRPLVAPVLPPASPVPGGAGRPSAAGTARGMLPVAPLTLSRSRSTVYGLATIDCNGRIADTAISAALGWVPGTRVDIGQSAGLVVVAADSQGEFCVSAQGHLRLPAPCGTGADCSRATGCCWRRSLPKGGWWSTRRPRSTR